jgi:hypothetical protein
VRRILDARGRRGGWADGGGSARRARRLRHSDRAGAACGGPAEAADAAAMLGFPWC